MGYIKNARITRVFGGLLDVALELDIGAGIRCTTPYIRNTPEDNHIVFDFLGVSNWSQLKNKHIRVWIPGFGGTYSLEDVHMIGRERDNKWLDLKRREVVCCRVHWGGLYPVDEKEEREEINMVMEIKDARIVTAFLTKEGDLYEFLLDVDLYDDRRYIAPHLLITHEALCTFFDVVGVRSGVPVRNIPVRVLADDKGEVLLFGNSMDNKWVDLKRFEFMRVKGETVVPHTEDNKKERK